MTTLAEVRHELLKDIADYIAMTLEEHSIDQAVAAQAAAAAVDHLCQVWAGATLYIPMDYHFKLTQRDLEILSKFKGNNHHFLAQQYKLTPNAIYKLLKRIQDRKFERQQGKLDFFPATEEDGVLE